MGAARKDLIISQDLDFYYALELQNAADESEFDLTGYTAVAKVRAEPDSPSVIVALTCTIPDPATDGNLVITLTREQTTDLPLGIYNWDLAIISDTAPDIVLLEGKATVKARASR